MTQEVEDLSGSMNILGMFTVSDFPELFSRSNLMALIVFTIFFSIAIIMAGEKGKPVLDLMDSMTEVIIKVINIVMKIAPLGLGCYFAILIGQYGRQVVGPLGRAIVLYLFVIVAYYIVSQTVMAYIGAGAEGVRRWWKTAAAPTLTALGTCSSAATLSINMIQAKELGIPSDVADLTIPLGANLHKDGVCIIQIIKIALLCSVFGINYATPRNLFMSVVVAVIASVVMGGIPAGKKDKVVLACIIAGFLFSLIFQALPILSSLSGGTQTIILTVIISGAAAIIFPRKQEEINQ